MLTGLWPAYYLLYQHRTVGWRNIVSYVLVGITPVILAIAVTGAYNWLRFGSAFDNGLAYHAMAPRFVTDFLRYGAFDLHYVPTNMFYQYVAYPYPLGPDSFQGASLFLLSPVFVASIWGVIRGRPRLSTCAMAGTIALVATPILLLMGTGWVQFGPRYTLDFTVPLLLLTAIGIRYWPVWIVAALTVVSLAHYLTGIFYFSIVI